MLGDVMVMKTYNFEQIKKYFWNKKCVECECGNLKYTGSSPNGGWVSYYKCDNCDTEYEHQDSDMGQTLESLDSNADKNPKLPIELFKNTEEYFNSLGFSECGQYEWKNETGWVIEYLGTDERPNCWRIDDFNNEGHQILFIDLITKEDLEWLLKIVNVNIA